MNRRDFLKGLVATAAGVLVPGDLEPAKKIYALDSTMILRGRSDFMVLGGKKYPTLPDWIDALEPYETPVLSSLSNPVKIGDYTTERWFSEGEPDRYRVYIEYPKIVQFQEIYGNE